MANVSPGSYSQWMEDNPDLVTQVSQRVAAPSATPQSNVFVPEPIQSSMTQGTTQFGAAAPVEAAKPAQATDTEVPPSMQPKEGKGAGLGKVLSLVGSFFGGGVLGKVLGAVGGQLNKGGEQGQGQEGEAGGTNGGGSQIKAPDWSQTAQSYIRAFTGR